MLNGSADGSDLAITAPAWPRHEGYQRIQPSVGHLSLNRHKDIYYPLEFTNFSGHTCYLRGFPGVSATDRDGKQLGSPARWETFAPFGSPRTVILAPGATAHAMFAYHDAVIFTSPGCHAVSTASTRPTSAPPPMLCLTSRCAPIPDRST